MAKEDDVKEYDLFIRFKHKDTEIELQSYIVNHLLKYKMFDDLHL